MAREKFKLIAFSELDLTIFYEGIESEKTITDSFETSKEWEEERDRLLKVGEAQNREEPIFEFEVGNG